MRSRQGRGYQRSPVLIDTTTTFEDYLKRITKKARYEYKQSLKYTGWEVIEKDVGLIRFYMGLWERQLVGGKHPVFGFRVDEIITERICVTSVPDKALHICERWGDLIYAHPVMYDKTKTPGIAKYCWFQLIRWCTENGIKWLDLGAPNSGTFRDILKSRMCESYKFLYIPKDVKRNPDQQPEVRHYKCICGARYIAVDRKPCEYCGSPSG